jgi:hypothetical protein
MGMKILASSNLLLLRGEILSCENVLKVQHVMLIKWENAGAFLFHLLREENILTGDVLNKFYCILLLVSYTEKKKQNQLWPKMATKMKNASKNYQNSIYQFHYNGICLQTPRFPETQFEYH